jgi:endonuclease III
MAASESDIEALIKPVTYYSVKARYLVLPCARLY